MEAPWPCDSCVPLGGEMKLSHFALCAADLPSGISTLQLFISGDAGT